MVCFLARWHDSCYNNIKTHHFTNLTTNKEETIMRKNKRTITILGCIGIFLSAALMLVPAAQAGEKTVKYKITGPITRLEVIPVLDVKGHAIGMLERRGVAIYENGEVAAYHTRATFDAIKKKGGSFNGYSTYTFSDGSTIITKYQGTTTMSGGKKLLKGTGENFKGTGRYEGIKGKVTFNGAYVTPYTKDKTKGDTLIDCTSTYTLPKK